MTCKYHEHSQGKTLYDLARMRKWQSVSDRVASHPSEAMWCDHHGFTPLHACLRREPPVEVVLALLSAAGPGTMGIASLRTNHGEYPLHIACSYEPQIDVVRILIDSNRTAVSAVDVDGQTPLHRACDIYPSGASTSVIRALLEVDVKVVSRCDVHGKTALALLGERCYDILHSGNMLFQSNPTPSNALVHHLGGCYEKLSLILKAAYHGTIADILPDRIMWRVVHASVAVVGCPLPFIQLALKVHPGQIRERDEHGRLPIHIAASRSSIATGIRVRDESIIVESLLDAYPESAQIVDSLGRRPLDLAINSRKAWEEGVKAILDAYPEALASRDICWHSLPCVMSKSGNDEVPSTLFELLRCKPELMKMW